MSWFRLSGAVLACMVLALSGCASKPAKPVAVKAVILASADVNPDDQGRPSPVVVRIYQLRDNAAFLDADAGEAGYAALVDREKETLGASLILRAEQPVFPGQKVELDLTLSPDAHFIGAIAEFRDVRSTSWRASFGSVAKPVLKMISKNKVTIRVGQRDIKVSTRD